MSSKQRVREAISHGAPDRVPLDYLANPEIHQRLKEHYRLAADDHEGLLRALGVDVRQVNAPFVGTKRHADVPGRHVDEWGMRRRWVEHGTGGYWDYCDWPLRDASVDEVEAWPLPDPDEYDYAAVAEGCRRHAECFVVVGHAGMGDVINSTGMLRTMEQVLVDLLTDDEAGLRLIDRKNEVRLEVARRSLAAAAGAADMLWLGEDLGTQIGPMISLDLFRKHIRPRLQLYVDLAREWGIPAMIHSCGSSSWAFDDFLEMGITVVDTLQPEAKDMAPAYLKGRWGERLAFHGCISTAGAVAYGTVDEVVETVRQTLAAMMPGGGYVLAPTHALQSNSPTENVVAMYDAAREYGVY